MSGQRRYNDASTGKVDSNLRSLLNERSDGSKMRNLLLNVIKNELTARQKQIIMLYYFKGLNIVEISEMCEVTPQAVSAIFERARKKLY